MDLSALSPDERDEYDAVVDEALNGDREVTAEKVARLDAMLHDAERAHRSWATVILRQARREGLRNILKKQAKAEAVILVDYEGHAVGKSMRVGRRVLDEIGRESWQQSLIHDMTWDELTAHLKMIESQIGALLVNQHVLKRLLTLRETYPDSAGPREACEQAGTSIESFLGAVA